MSKFFKNLERNISHGAKPILGTIGGASKSIYKEVLKPVAHDVRSFANKEADVLVAGQKGLISGASGILDSLGNPLIILAIIFGAVVIVPKIMK